MAKLYFYRFIFLTIFLCSYIVNGQEAATVKSTEEATKTAETANADTATKQDATKSTEVPKNGNVESKSENDKVTKSKDQNDSESSTPHEIEVPVQSGPYIDLLGERLYSLEMIDDSKAQMHAHYTNEVLRGKKVVGLYFSADW